MSKRKSDIGSNPKISAEPPPCAHGQPWWTEPPTVVPLQEHIEYAGKYRQHLIESLNALGFSKRMRAQQLIARVNEWLKFANIRVSEHEAKVTGLDKDGALLLAMSRLLKDVIKASDRSPNDNELKVLKAADLRMRSLRGRLLVPVKIRKAGNA